MTMMMKIMNSDELASMMLLMQFGSDNAIVIDNEQFENRATIFNLCREAANKVSDKVRSRRTKDYECLILEDSQDPTLKYYIFMYMSHIAIVREINY